MILCIRVKAEHDRKLSDTWIVYRVVFCYDSLLSYHLNLGLFGQLAGKFVSGENKLETDEEIMRLGLKFTTNEKSTIF